MTDEQDHIPYGLRQAGLRKNSHMAPAQDEGNDAWARGHASQEAARAREWGATESQRAYGLETEAAQFANATYDVAWALQADVQERRIDGSKAVAGLEDLERRLVHLRTLRQRVDDQMARATYLYEQPHRAMDELWAKFPHMNDRGTPPHGQIVRLV